MGDLKDRDVLMGELNSVVCERIAHSNTEYDRNMCRLAEYMLAKLINRTPTVDAVTVKHGHWVDNSYALTCSICHKWFILEQGDADMNYCPHCGAKMDEEV